MKAGRPAKTQEVGGGGLALGEEIGGGVRFRVFLRSRPDSEISWTPMEEKDTLEGFTAWPSGKTLTQGTRLQKPHLKGRERRLQL